MEIGSDLIITNRDCFENFYMNATGHTKRSKMGENNILLSDNEEANANVLIPPSKQATSDLGATAAPNLEINLYDCLSNCNFVVFVETCADAEGNRININSNLYFYDYLKDFGMYGLKELKVVSRGRAKLLFSSAANANNFVTKNEFNKKNLKAYIPRSFTERFGVIRNIPCTYSVDDIINNAVSDIPIKSAVRFQRRNPNNKDEWIPTTRIKVGFKGRALPKAIKFNYCNLPVEYFVPTLKQCFKCGRYGHVSKFCKAKESRCLNCGKSPNGVNCEAMKCLSCGSGEHNALDKCCLYRESELNINRIMAIKNLSHKEVKENFSENYFECLDDNTYDGNFPPLGNTSAISTKDDNQNANKILTKNKYNAVVKRKLVPSKSLINSPIKPSPNTPPKSSGTSLLGPKISNNYLWSSELERLILTIQESIRPMIPHNLIKEFEEKMSVCVISCPVRASSTARKSAGVLSQIST
ncbi:uncharacterized protein ACN427_010668 isoform 1-T1 [Glossina fuscipes fuscipes]